MSAVVKLEQDESKISEPMSWDEIRAVYRDAWVSLVDIDWVDFNAFDFRTARVLCHSKKHEEALEESKAWRWRFYTMGCFFTGDMRNDSDFWEYTGELIPEQECEG